MKLSSLYHPLHTTAVFILHHSAVGGGGNCSWRGNRIETGKNLNPVQNFFFWGGGKMELLGGNYPPPKDA
jgi:hypothetical protein